MGAPLLSRFNVGYATTGSGRVFKMNEESRAIEETLWTRGGRSFTVEGSFGVEGGYRGAMALLQRDPRPTAIIAAGNTLMAGALRAIHELELEVGRDVSFVGCDNVLIAELHQPPIAVVFRDASTLGREGAKLLLQALAEKDPKQLTLDDVVLPTQFMARPSCAAPPS